MSVNKNTYILRKQQYNIRKSVKNRLKNKCFYTFVTEITFNVVHHKLVYSLIHITLISAIIDTMHNKKRQHIDSNSNLRYISTNSLAYRNLQDCIMFFLRIVKHFPIS